MSFNQQLRESRMVNLLTPRLIAYLTLVAAAVLTVGCASSSAVKEAPAPSSMSTANSAAEEKAPDLTATEAAVSGLNDAPAEAPVATANLIRPDAPMNYTVKRGDTLWDIASVFLKDPWFWPEIWQINPQVENPHLIYPGDVLSLAYGAGGDATVRLTQSGAARLSPRLRSEQLDSPIDTIPFAAIAAFLSRPGVITKDEALKSPHILTFRDNHMIAGTGHEAYVRGLDGGLNSRYTVVHVAEPIRDVETNDVLGYQAVYVATAVVTNPGEVSKALLTEGAREVLEGDRLISADSNLPATFTPHAPRTEINGQIISVIDGAEQIGQYQVVVLNRGSNHGVDPGVVLAIDQSGAVVKDRASKRPWGKRAFPRKVRLPDERAGTLMVFRVYDRMSYGLVIGARNPMQVADRVHNP
jgi:LysM repeat protein